MPVPLAVRLLLAVPLVVWGALTDRRWTVPVAAMLALPILWVNGLSMLVGVLPLVPRIVGATPAARWLASSAATATVPTATDPDGHHPRGARYDPFRVIHVVVLPWLTQRPTGVSHPPIFSDAYARQEPPTRRSPL